MKQKILKLIKILNRFTIDDLITLSGADEHEIQDIIIELQQEKIINQISKTEYGYIKSIESVIQKTIIQHKTVLPTVIKRKINVSEININEFFDKKNEINIYNKSPDWAKPVLIKYTTVLRLAGNLRGQSLQKFINKLNEEHPEYKTSYSTLQRLRSRYRLFGLKGLIPNYDKNRNKTVVPSEMYEKFKELYLNSKRYSVKRCLDIIARTGNYDIIPTRGCFKRLLLKEYSPEVIENLRNMPLQLPTLELVTSKSSIAKEKDITNRTEFFIEGANLYLEEIKGKTTDSEICRCGYIKNHLIPYYKDFKFEDITQDVISQYVSEKLANGYSAASIGRFIYTLSIIVEKYSITERQFSLSSANTTSFLLNTKTLTESEIKKIANNNTPELWYLALGIKPAELAALTFNDIDFKNRTVKINKIQVQDKIQKYRTSYQKRELRIPQIIYSKLKRGKGKMFNNITAEKFDTYINTHIKLMIDKNVQINILSKNLGFQSVSDFIRRYNFLLPQELDKGFEIL